MHIIIAIYRDIIVNYRGAKNIVRTIMERPLGAPGNGTGGPVVFHIEMGVKQRCTWIGSYKETCIVIFMLEAKQRTKNNEQNYMDLASSCDSQTRNIID